jgi:hypothetical protein
MVNQRSCSSNVLRGLETDGLDMLRSPVESAIPRMQMIKLPQLEKHQRRSDSI